MKTFLKDFYSLDQISLGDDYVFKNAASADKILPKPLSSMLNVHFPARCFV